MVYLVTEKVNSVKLNYISYFVCLFISVLFMFLGLGLTNSILENVSVVSCNGTVTDILQDLAHSMVNHLVGSRSDNIINNYFSAFNKWKTFSCSENLKVIPAEPVHIALFLTNLINKDTSVIVIQHVVYGIKWAHTLRGVSDPTDNHYVHNLVESGKRHNSVQKTKNV